MAELKLDLSRVDQVITASNAGVDGEGGGEMGGEGGGVDSFTDMYDNLPPLEKLERYFQSEDALDREMAVRCIPEALEVATSHSEYQLILEISMTLANDHEPTIRMLILDTVAVLLEHHSRLRLTSDSENGMENKERLFDVPIRMVSDINQQVRRISQNCVISLLEDETKNKDVLINQLVPEMERCLSRDEHYDLRMDMSLLLSRLAPLLGREVLVRKFVPLFPSLGRDAMFHVRKAFAMGCRDICPVLGEDLTEQHILQPFCDLCHDDVWGVRKACADVFADVAMYCNLGTRHDRLTPTFLRLLQDDSRWVRRAAFEHLGSFIATFYVSLGSEDEQSSINPFSDSILLDNSLLPAHEEDGIWVGGAEDDKTSPIAQSERGGSDSGTGTGESGMGNVPGNKEEEEPFFLFMDTPISWGRKEGKDKEKGGEDSAVEERGGEREEGERKGEVLALELNTESDSLKNKCSPTPVERLTEENVSSSGEEESLENERVSSQPVERLELDLREGALIGVDNLGSNAEAEEKVVEGAGEVNAANSEGHVGEGETRKKGVEEKQEVDEEEREGVLLLEQSQDNGNEEETETKTDEAHSSTKGEKGGGGNDKEEGEREEEEGKEEKAEIQTVEGEEEEKEQREVDSESPKQSTVAAEEENSTCEKKEAPTGQEEAENEGSTGQEEAENEAPTGQEETENEAPTGEKEGSGGCGVREGGCGEEEELAAPPHVDCSGGVREGEDEVPGSETNVSSDSETGSDVSSGQGREEDGGGREEGEGVREGGESIPEPCEEGETPESQGVQSAEDTATQNKFPPIRVLVHTTAGQVMEPTCDDTMTMHTTAPHNRTGHHDNSVSMEITLASTPDSSPNTTMIDSFAYEMPSQEIVPDELMDLYLSMTDSSKSQTVDSDLPYYCAFCLPGVVLTLGAKNWPLLRITFLTLSGDMQWKIRRVLAFSLHELARILGTHTTVTDLYPTFEEYCTKDVDDVKIGVLSHLTEFIEVLPISLRRSCLPEILKGLRDVENPKNWRHKHTLVEQLVTLCDLYDADYLHSHIYPVAKELMKDRVHEVRQSATQLLGMVLQRLTQITPDGYLPVLRDMRTEYASHKWWNFRQLYISQCRMFVVEQCISSEVFVSECLPNLLPLVADKVPNVRLALARAVGDILTNKDYFETDKEQTVEQLESILHTLRSDTDRDVVYFAGGDVSSFVRPHPLGGDLRYRSLSQASEDQYHDAVETLDGGRPREEHEAWLRSWEEALSGPTLQLTGEIR